MYRVVPVITAVFANKLLSEKSEKSDRHKVKVKKGFNVSFIWPYFLHLRDIVIRYFKTKSTILLSLCQIKHLFFIFIHSYPVGIS